MLRAFVFIPMLTVSAVKPPVACHGRVAKISNGEYYYHDNGTYLLRVSTNVNLKLELAQASCFQINIEPAENDTTKVAALFYVVKYLEYLQYYPVRRSYQFGIPEFQSYCKCDCPKADTFCTHSFGHRTCSKGEICITKYHPFQISYGCQDDGPASLCCELSVKPYEGRRFTAINLKDPTPQVEILIEIYALYQEQWSLFRKYTRKLLPFRGNSLHLNGYENVAEMYINAKADHVHNTLLTGDKYYIFEDHQISFRLLDNPSVNDLHEHYVDKLGWLRYNDGRWYIYDPLGSIQDLHKPIVSNCKQQAYIDRFDINTKTSVIRNSTGAVHADPFLGFDVLQDRPYVNELQVYTGAKLNDITIMVTHKQQMAPNIDLDITLHQKMTVVAHVHASNLEDYVVKINLDKHMNRYLNITLINAYGQFLLDIMDDSSVQTVDVALSLATVLPYANNFTDILPLPPFITSARMICVYLDTRTKSRMCKWAAFEKEPVLWFAVRNTFIETEGSCPGCNIDETSSGFWGNFDPRKWMNGIGSFSEGVALAVEIAVYILIVLVLFCLWRKLIWPLVKWTFCSSSVGTMFRTSEKLEHV